MDSKVVDRALREELWPALEAAGFVRRAGRTAWRDVDAAVQCVSIRSFTTYLAGRMGATTFSIGVNLGVFYPAIADRSVSGGFVSDQRRPKEHECHVRRILTKSLSQPSEPQPSEPHRVLVGLLPAAPALGRWVDRPDVWLILPDGSNMMMCVRDAAERIAEVGIPWLNRLSVPAEAIRCLMQEPNVYGDRGVILEMYGGALGSPDRWQKVGALAAATGDAELLRQAVDQMAGQRYWEDHPRDLDTLRAELAALN